jgi:hypothetical protein
LNELTQSDLRIKKNLEIILEIHWVLLLVRRYVPDIRLPVGFLEQVDHILSEYRDFMPEAMDEFGALRVAAHTSQLWILCEKAFSADVAPTHSRKIRNRRGGKGKAPFVRHSPLVRSPPRVRSPLALQSELLRPVTRSGGTSKTLGGTFGGTSKTLGGTSKTLGGTSKTLGGTSKTLGGTSKTLGGTSKIPSCTMEMKKDSLQPPECCEECRGEVCTPKKCRCYKKNQRCTNCFPKGYTCQNPFGYPLSHWEKKEEEKANQDPIRPKWQTTRK